MRARAVVHLRSGSDLVGGISDSEVSEEDLQNLKDSVSEAATSSGGWHFNLMLDGLSDQTRWACVPGSSIDWIELQTGDFS